MFDLNYLWPFLLFFGMNLLAGVGFPFPEELTFAGAGVWCAHAADTHQYVRWLILPVSIVGVILADGFLYGVGRWWGPRLLQNRWFSRVVPPERRARIERNFRRYGISILIFGRLVPSIRTPLFLTSGMMRLSVAKFLIADGIGAVLGGSLLFGLGYWFGESFLDLVHRVEDQFQAWRPAIIIGAVGLVLAYLVWHFVRFPVATGDPKEDIPLIGPQVAQVIDQSAQAAGAKKEQAAVGTDILLPPQPASAPD